MDYSCQTKAKIGINQQPAALKMCGIGFEVYQHCIVQLLTGSRQEYKKLIKFKNAKTNIRFGP